jgi:hypothetical protein
VAFCYDLGRNMTMSFSEGVTKTKWISLPYDSSPVVARHSAKRL